MGSLPLPAGYSEVLERLKRRIRTARVTAVVAANSELMGLYWDIGRVILERQHRDGWGKSVVKRLAQDLQADFPGVGGFSPDNVWRMRAFYREYSAESGKLAQAVPVFERQGPPAPVAGIPWGHNVLLLQRLANNNARLWYAQKSLELGWSRAILLHQIESGLYERQGKAVTNFKATLPPLQSDLAEQAIKDPYTFDFLTLAADAREKELERGLVDHVRKFLLELGAGFAFVGQQVHLEVGGDDFYIDLLFYNLKLRCFVVVELKNGPFKPEYAGKMSFYLSAVDDRMRHKDDQASVGIILCRAKNKLVAEYALRDVRKPIGVSAFRLTKALPAALKGTLPSVGELEDGLGSE
jgi:predicted nuclease of restriction endonuclease-like (RecB) superfamily